MFDAAAAATASEVASEHVAQEQAEAAVSSDNASDGPSAEQPDSQQLMEAITTYNPGESRTEVAFVDPTVPNYQELLAGMDPNVEIIMLDGGQDGVEQMASALEGRTGIDAIHVISHGSSGELQLGTGTLNAQSMSGEYVSELSTIRESLSEQADVLVYGCNFAEGSEGADAVNLLAELTGADVAASTDQTGHIDLGGDWEFEMQAGSVETDLALTDTAQMNWAGILGTETVKDTFSAESYGNNNGTQSWASNWSETDASGGGASGGDVRVNSGQLRIDTDTVGNQASRQVNLSGTSGATLTFNYSNTLTGADRIEARISNDGGATYVTLAGGVFSNAANTGSGTATLDISAYASANTRIQFIVTGTGGGDRLYVDNVQVSYDTGPANSAPTISSNGAGATASVSVTENSSTVTTVTATDADAGQTLSYSITGGADAAQFTINSSTGQLSFVSAPNYEAPTDSGGNNIYDVTVQVSDGQGGTDTQAIAVTVTDSAESSTILTAYEPALSSMGDQAYELKSDQSWGQSFQYNSSDPTYSIDQVGLVLYRASDAPQQTLTVSIRSSWDGSVIASGTISSASLGTSEAWVNVNLTSVAVLNDSATYVIQVEATGAGKVYAGVNDSGTYTDGTLINKDGVSEGSKDMGFRLLSTNVSNSSPAITSQSGGATASVSVTENSSTVTTVTATDADAGQSLTYSIAGGADAAQFTINSSTGQLSFVSAPNYEVPTDGGGNNIYDVTVQVSDGQGGTDTQAISVTVANANETPTDLSLSSSTVAENAATGTVVGTVTGTDPDAGDTQTYSLTDTAGGRFAIDAATGVLTVADGSLLNYEAGASHTVTVQVTDSGGQTYTETFTIQLTNVNETPTGADATVTINEDTSHTLTTANFGFSDVDAGDSLSAVRIDSLPGAGSLTLSGVAVTAGQVVAVADITAGNLVFTPAANASGTGYASVTFSVRDSNNAYDVAPNTLTVHVTGVNDATVVTGGTSGTGSEDTPVTGTLTATDVEGLSDGTVFTVSTNAANGTASIDPATGLWSYTPAADWNGTDSFTVTVTDDAGNTTTQVVSVTVTPVVDITNDSLTTAEDTAISANMLTGTNGATADSFEGTPELTSVTQGANGTVTFLADGTVTYTPHANFHGPDSFTYTVTSGGVPETTTVTVNVTAVNDATMVTGDTSGTGNEDTTLTGTLTATDVEGLSDGTVFTVSTNAANGTASIDPATGLWSYTPAADWNGTDSFTVTITDDAGHSSTQVISVTVTAVNDAPTDLSLSANTVAENAATGIVVGTVTGSDPDAGDTKTYSLTDTAGGRFAIDPTTGQLTVADGSLLNYERATNHSVTVRVTDSGGLTYDQTFTINLTNVNEAPTDLSLSAISIAENAATGTVVGTVTSTDPDAGDTKTYSLTDTAGGRFAIDVNTGVITVADGSLLNYEAAASHNLTVQVTDSAGQSYSETFTIQLTNVDEAPTDVQKENGGGPPFLHSNRPVVFEGSARPAYLSQIKDDTSEGEGRVPDDVRKPVEWSSQPAPLLDALRSDRNLAGRAHDGDGTKVVGSEQDRASSTSPRTQDETAVNLEPANAAHPELEQVPWPPTAETENVPDDSGGLGVPMAVGLVGAVLQGHLGKKERMMTLTGQNPTRDRQPAKEQNSEQPSVDDQVVPPSQH